MAIDSELYFRSQLDPKRIANYVRIALPDDAPYFGKAAGVKTPETERLAICLNDPKFGWNFVNSYKKAQKPLPSYVIETGLRFAFYHLTKPSRDQDLLYAITLTDPRNTAQRNLLKGLLMSRDISLSKIAQRLQMSKESLRLFCELFFNVRLRLEDAGFITNLLYPKGRFDTYRVDSMENKDPGLLMMQAGYKYGANEVFTLAGLDRKEDAKVPVDKLYDEFEDLVMQNAVMLGRHGYLNAKSNPGIAHAKSFSAAKRKTNESPSAIDNRMGLSAISMGQGIMEVLRATQGPDVEQRRKLQMQRIEMEARREKTAKAEQSP